MDNVLGEKDPRNILIVFQLYDFALKNCHKIEAYKQEIFDYLDCYYPIQFNENADNR